MRLFADNPLIERYRFSSLRPKQCWIYGFIFTTVVLIMVMINLANHVERGVVVSVADLCTSLYYQFFALLTVVLCVLSSSSSAGAIREEFAERSYDFFRMLPLSAHYKAVGILLGRNLLILIMAGVLAVLATFTGVSAGLSPGLILQMLLCVLALAFFFNCLSLFSAISPNRKVGAQSSQIVGVVAIVLLILPFMIGGMMTLSRVSDLEVLMVPFFATKVPLLLIIAAIAIYLSVWLYLGICRKFDKEGEPVMTKPGALIFQAGAMIILLGLLGPHMGGEESFAAVSAYWAASLVITVFLPPGYSLGRQRYMEMRSLNADMPLTRFLLTHSNLSVATLLYGMWAITAIATAWIAPETFDSFGIHVIILFSFYLIFCALMEITATTDPINGRLKTLLTFLGLLHAFLPLLMAATLGSGEFLAFSILGYFGMMIDNDVIREAPVIYVALAVNICLLALLWLFIKQAYEELFPAKPPRN